MRRNSCPTDYQNFITLAILSGIIGGISSDTVKFLINKLYQEIKNIDTNLVYFIDDLKFEHHRKRIQDYYHFLPNVEDEVKLAISEETVAELFEKDTNIVSEEYFVCNAKSKKYYMKKVTEARKANKKRLPSQYFNGFWGKI